MTDDKQPKASCLQTIGVAVVAVVVCAATGALALGYVFFEMLPSLAH